MTVDINFVKILFIYYVLLQDEAICRYQPSCSGASMTEYVDVWPSEHALQAAVAQVGPISVGIDAGHVSFQVAICMHKL